MITAIASKENHLKSLIDPHFGRCDWFCIYDSCKQESTFYENRARYNQEKAGIEAANFLLEKGVKTVVAGRFGSKVVDIFKEKKIQMVIPGSPRTLNDIICSLKMLLIYFLSDMVLI